MEWLGVLGTLVIPLAAWIWKVHTNDLHAIKERLDRIEAKLDTHLEWHLNHPPE